jgi:diguanylate cyclase (GGDEF)-like protein
MEKSAQLEAAIENTDQGVVMTDADLNTVTFNSRFCEMLDLPPEIIIPGEPYEKVIRVCAERGDFGTGNLDVIVAERVRLLASSESFVDVRTRSNGRVLELRRRPIPGGGAVTTYTDITDTHKLTQQLAYQARHDSLTSLVNRREFESQLERVLKVSRDEQSAHAICYLDLDQFKVINDTCGHAAGDELLRQLAVELRKNIRKSDLLARLGGDEFGALLENCSLSEAHRVADSLRRCVEEFRFTWLERSFPVGVSIGLVPVNAGSGSVTEVLSAADAACYTAKDQGRNRVHLYSVGDVELTQRHGEMQWVTRLQDALENGQLCLMYQTIAPLEESVIEGEHYELLVRMRDDDGGLIPPGMFLPAAERYNLVGRIDRWVVRHAFDVFAEDPALLDALHTCSINLSGHSVSDESFHGFIVDEFKRSGVPPAKIVFEVTETAAITHLTRATEFMMALREIGCRFSLDDFGSGLSSFGYLKTLPVDYLKIDGMFVKDILDDPIDHSMVKCINEIGQVMGKLTVAEFVENDDIRAAVRELGVDYAQGYGIGRPRPFPARQAQLRRVS